MESTVFCEMISEIARNERGVIRFRNERRREGSPRHAILIVMVLLSSESVAYIM